MGFTVFMRSNPDFPAFNQALNASLNGDATGFAYVPIFDIRETVVVPLLCSDFRTLSFFFSEPGIDNCVCSSSDWKFERIRGIQ
jgi:hypothetical protein